MRLGSQNGDASFELQAIIPGPRGRSVRDSCFYGVGKLRVLETLVLAEQSVWSMGRGGG